MNTTRHGRSLLLLVTLAAVASAASAQERPGRIPAPLTPPPDARLADSAQAPAARQGRNTRESLIERLRNAQSSNAIAAPDTPPPDAVEAEQQAAPAESRTRPTVRTLIEKIRTLPGGPQMLQDAKRRGARISTRGVLPLFGSFGGVLATAGPRVEETVGTDEETQAAYSVTLTPSTYSQTNPSALFRGWGALVGASFSSTAYWYLCNCARPPIGSTFTKPYTQFQFTITRAGWYIVSFDASPNKTTIWRWTGLTYVTVSNFDYTGAAGIQSYPVLVELAAGTHYFYLVGNVGGLYVYEANAFSL